MKKLLFITLIAGIFATFNYAYAQYGFGTNAPNSNAIVDMVSDHMGLLIPRVSLQGLTDATTIPSPAISMIVFNTGTGGATPLTPAGFYYWNGSSWTRLLEGATGVNFGNIITGTNTSATMTVGTGATLTFSGSGVVNANKFNLYSGAGATDAIDLGTIEVAGQLPIANIVSGSANQFLVTTGTGLAWQGLNLTGATFTGDGVGTALNIATSGVTNGMLATDAVSTVKIANSAVTTAKIASGNVGQVLMTTAGPATSWGTLSSANITTGNLTTTTTGLNITGTGKVVDADIAVNINVANLMADLTPTVSGGIAFTGATAYDGSTAVNIGIAPLGITNAMLAGSISNDKLVNSKVTIGTTDISLGGSATTIVGLSSVTSTNFIGNLTGNVTGNASTATSIAGGVANNLLYQTAPGVTGFVGVPADGQILKYTTGGGIAWAAPTSITLANLSAGTGLSYSIGGPYNGSATATLGIADGGVGTTQLANNAVTYSKLQNASASGLLLVSGTTPFGWGETTVANLMADLTPTASGGIAFTGGTAYDGSAAVNIGIAPLGITNAMLAGSITNDKLVNKTIAISNAGGLTITGSPIELGGTAGTIALDLGHSNTWTAAQNFANVAITGTITVGSTPSTGTAAQVLHGGATPTWGGITASDVSLANLTQGTGITTFTYNGSATATVGLANGTAAGQVYVTGATPFAPALATMSGDATIASSGLLTLATVNSNTGSWGLASSVPQFSVNGKGLITAATNVSIQIAESQVTNLITDLGSKVAANSGISAGTNTKISYDTKGLVTASTSAVLASADYVGQGAANNVLIGGGVSPATPSWGLIGTANIASNAGILNSQLANSTIGLTSSGSSITVGTSPISLGGTSNIDLNMGHTNSWTASQTFADMTIGGKITAGSTPTVGTAGQVLTSNGTAGGVSWGNLSSGALNLADGKIFIGNVSGIAAEQTVSGDVSITNAGVTAIGAKKVLTSMINNGTSNQVLLTNGAGDAATWGKVAAANMTITTGAILYGGASNAATELPVSTNGYVLTLASGSPAWVAPSTLTVTETDPKVGTLTNNKIPKWGTTTLVDGIITDNGTTASVGGALSTTGNASIGGTLGVTGATTLSSTLGVTGAATLSSTLTLNSGITATNDARMLVMNSSDYSVHYRPFSEESIREVSGTVTLDISDGTIITTAASTITLPSTGIYNGKKIVIKNGGSGFSVSVTAGGTITIDGSATFAMNANWQGATFQYLAGTPNKWFVVARF